MARARDSQRSKFFEVHNYIGALCNRVPHTEVPKLVKAALGSIVKRYPDATRRLSFKMEGGRCDATSGRFSYPKADSSLHEIAMWTARVLAYRTDMWSEYAYYGREFCAIYLDVVRVMMGAGMHDLLKARMKIAGVKYTAKRSG